MARCFQGRRFSAFLSRASAGRSLLLLLSPARSCKSGLHTSPAARRAPRFASQASTQQSAALLPDQRAREGNGGLGGGAGSGDGSGVTFQDAVVRLQEYWSSVGCTLWQPHNAEVGAGTMNPATFLRVVGPEGWKVCYVEPSVRPDDSRYGENPNRLQQHTQMQVILKPEPGNPQELYLGSLGALGIDTEKHDIRFVEDNWENPALGAWGLGWEVWMDGQEITQFTYFQQAGGQPLEFPSVEITYGLERILTALQGVSHFKDIQFNSQATYGDIYLQAEYEMSCFNLDQADIAIHHQLYELYEREAGNMVDKKLPLPAYQCLLKLSHVFNILDARGAVGVTQRAKCFATMRRLARSITELWLQRRAELGHPLGVLQAAPAQAAGRPDLGSLPSSVADLLVEVGCEELPPADIQAACEQLRAKAPGFLKKLALQHGEISVHSTPRRLVLHVADTAASQTSSSEKLRGPPAKAAFGEGGAPTKALAGFCKKNGVAEDAVSVEADSKGVEYVWAVKQNVGRPAAEVLTEELGALVAEIRFKRSMRWNGRTAFSRPVRWLLAFLGPTVLPFAFAGLATGARTYGPRSVGYLDVAGAGDYWQKLESVSIAGRREERKRAIWGLVTAAAQREGGRISAQDGGGLLEEVTDLVESPTVLLGSFDSSFLQLPAELLTTVMRKHQRYFAVRDEAGGLMARFVTIANGSVDPEVVVRGNEAVLRARFQDALFFYETDLKRRLEEYRPALASITFQKDLGSMLDKTGRLEQTVPALARLCGLTGAVDVALKAARLAKADLATAVVTEMTDLAGVIGRHYALQQGADEAVAEAIFETALPRQAGDALPSTSAGLLCSVADRLDSLVGLFAAGHAPTATADIYGLRRAAYGMLETLLSSGTRLDLREAIAATAGAQPIAVSEEARAAVFDFVAKRVEQLLVDRGVSVQVARAVLAERARDPTLAWASAQALQAEVDRKEGGSLQTAVTILSRPMRLVRGKGTDAALDPALFTEPEERALFAATEAVAAKVSADMSIPDFLQAAAELEHPVTDFFDKIFVMCEDAAVRNNRIALLQRLASLPAGIMDLTALPG